jgi:hypothetical protein
MPCEQTETTLRLAYEDLNKAKARIVELERDYSHHCAQLAAQATLLRAAEDNLLKYTQQYSAEMEIVRKYEPKLAAVEKAARSLLKLIGDGPEGITPDTEGTYSQRVLALVVALGKE